MVVKLAMGVGDGARVGPEVGVPVGVACSPAEGATDRVGVLDEHEETIAAMNRTVKNAVVR
jgi:hypothetical protein